MTSTVAVYFNYRDMVSVLGSGEAKEAMAKHVDAVFDAMDAICEGPNVSVLVKADGITDTEEAEYGAIAVFEYERSVSIEAAIGCADWVADGNKKGHRVPIVGLVHSRGGLILTHGCAMYLFATTLSQRPTVYSMERHELKNYITLARQVFDNKLYIDGCVLCTRPTCYVVCTMAEGVVKVTKEEALDIVAKHSDRRPSDSIVVHSYDGGNLLHDCQFISHVQSLCVISYTCRKRIVISSDLQETSSETSARFPRKLVVGGIVSFTMDKKVTFADKTHPVYVPFSADDKLFG